MSDELTDPVVVARRSYAEELRFTAHIRAEVIIRGRPRPIRI